MATRIHQVGTVIDVRPVLLGSRFDRFSATVTENGSVWEVATGELHGWYVAVDANGQEHEVHVKVAFLPDDADDVSPEADMF